MTEAVTVTSPSSDGRFSLKQLLGEDAHAEVLRLTMEEIKHIYDGARATSTDPKKPIPYTKGQSKAIRHALMCLVMRAQGSELLLGRAFDGVDDRFKALEQSVDKLQARIKTLESKQVSYEGVWAADKTYRRGMMVTDHGSIWHARRSTKARPGGGNSDWQLAVKRGQDGRVMR